MAFLVPNCDLPVCHTGEAQINPPGNNSWGRPGLVEGDGAVA